MRYHRVPRLHVLWHRRDYSRNGRGLGVRLKALPPVMPSHAQVDGLLVCHLRLHVMASHAQDLAPVQTEGPSTNLSGLLWRVEWRIDRKFLARCRRGRDRILGDRQHPVPVDVEGEVELCGLAFLLLLRRD